MVYVAIVGKEDKTKDFAKKAKEILPDIEIKFIDHKDKNAMYKQINNKITAYVCGESTCSMPATDMESFENILKAEASRA